jgi:Argininosuccinate lyase
VIDTAYRNWSRLYQAEFWAVQRAHLVGLAKTGIIEADIASALAAAIERLRATIAWPEAIPRGFEDMYFVFEHELETLVGPERAAFLHTARSRNDMDNSVFRLALRKQLLDLSRRMLDSLGAILDRARGSDGELTILFTHGQPANVSTMGHYLTAIACDLAEDLQGLLEALDTVDRSTMGACAITGTGFPLDRGLVAELLGFPGFVVNSYRAISSSHWLSRPAGALEELLLDLTRIAADILHKASSEVGLVRFPDELIQVSSIMPQKRNPVIIEHIRIQAGLAASASTGLRQLLRNVPYQDVNEAADAPVSALIDSLSLAASAIDLAGETLVKMRSDEHRAAASLSISASRRPNWPIPWSARRKSVSDRHTPSAPPSPDRGMTGNFCAQASKNAAEGRWAFLRMRSKPRCRPKALLLSEASLRADAGGYEAVYADSHKTWIVRKGESSRSIEDRGCGRSLDRDCAELRA